MRQARKCTNTNGAQQLVLSTNAPFWGVFLILVFVSQSGTYLEVSCNVVKRSADVRHGQIGCDVHTSLWSEMLCVTVTMLGLYTL